MMIELDAILGSDLATMVFLYGSAACFIGSAAIATWLLETGRPRMVLRPAKAAS